MEKTAKTMEELRAKFEIDLKAVNDAISADENPATSIDALNESTKALNGAHILARIKELAAMDNKAFYAEYMVNPYAVGVTTKKSAETGLFVEDTRTIYVPFDAIVAVKPDVVTSRDWFKAMHALRYNCVRFQVGDYGNASTNCAATVDDRDFMKRKGWDKKPSINSLVSEMDEAVAMILPEEMPCHVYKADVKQLIHAAMPAKGDGHESSNAVKRANYFTRQFFAMVATRLANKGYEYRDEESRSKKAERTGAEVSLKGTDPNEKNAAGVIYDRATLEAAAKKLGLSLVESGESEEVKEVKAELEKAAPEAAEQAAKK